MGAVEVPDNAYYGAQTQRAVENFPISGRTMPAELIHAFGLVKWACAKANAELGLLSSGRSPLSPEQVEALFTACLEVAEGKFDDQFPVDVYQTGSGTSTNMNANEVIARRANEIVMKAAGGWQQEAAKSKGIPHNSPPSEGWHFAQQNDGVVMESKDEPMATLSVYNADHPAEGGELFASAASCLLPPAVSPLIHPNDHVNLGQSSNDIFPTAIHLAVGMLIDLRLMRTLSQSYVVLREKAENWQNILKIGRTHLTDATPVTLGQEFSGFAEQLNVEFHRAWGSLNCIDELPVGGTAVGTGINTHPKFAEHVVKILNEYLEQKEWSSEEFCETSNHFCANANRDGLVSCHATIKSIAVTLFNIANNIRWLGSGPRSGFYEIKIPDLQPGSSIMPGKVNPVLCEALMQACARVIGNDQTMTFCGATGGQFQLNIMMPVMADTAIESVKILSGALEIFTEKCLKGLEANEEKCREGVEKSLSLATALNPYIGYEKAAEVAKEAFKTGKTVREVCLNWNVLPPEQLAEVLDPMRMTKSHE
jgi:fumarate hydratase class II